MQNTEEKNLAMAVTRVTMEVESDGVAVISISNPLFLNVLNAAMITKLKERFNEATRRKGVKAIILTRNEEGFHGVLTSVFFRMFIRATIFQIHQMNHLISLSTL